MRRSDDEREDGVSQEEIVALLASEGYSQGAIGKFLGLSQSTISRFLAAAESRGILIREVRLGVADRRARLIRAEVNRIKKWDGLRDRLMSYCGDSRLVTVDVIPTLGGEADPEADAWEAKCLEFGRRAARRVVDLLKQSRLVGVSYGRTLASVVGGLAHAAAHPGPPRDTPTRFFPTWTEPYEDANYRFVSKLFPSPADLSSTRLAKAFSRAINGRDDDVPALNCFPSLLPLDDAFSRRDLEVIRRFYHSNSSYHAVFAPPSKGQSGGLVHQMDTAIVGIGTTSPPGPKANPNWHVSNAVIVSAGFDTRQHEQAYLGDAGGVWLRRPISDDAPLQAAQAAEEYASLIADRWMGLTFGQLRKCADSAVTSAAVGVIALAVGDERREAVIEAVRSSLVNHLIIDTNLAAVLDAGM